MKLMSKKMNFLKLSLSAAALFSIFSLSSCKDKSKNTKLTLVMAEVNPPDTIVGRMDTFFAKKVKELSNGSIEIDLKCLGTLGNEEDVISVMMSPNSSIHLTRFSTFSLAKYNCDKCSLVAVPYTFSNRDHFWNFANSELADEILDEPYQKGIGLKGIFLGEEGFRNFFSVKPLNGVEDFENLKLRITPDKIMYGIAQGLKTEPVQGIGFADLYSALQRGTVEAAEQPVANYLANHLDIAAPYMILDGHTLGVTEVLILSELWDSLTDAQKKILKDAGKEASNYCRQISQEAEDNAKKQLLEKGAVIVEVNNIEPFQNACKDIISEATKDNTDLYKKILNFSK